MSPQPLGLGTDDAVAATTIAATAPAPEAEAETGIVSTVDPDVVAQPSKRLEIIVAAAALLFNVILLVAAQSIELRRAADPGQIDARFWPTILALLGIGLAVARLVIAIVGKPDERDDLERVQPGQMGKLLIALALTAGFLGVWSWKTATLTLFGLVIGFKLFVIVAPLYLAALLFVFGARGWKSLVIYPVVTTGFIYLLFGQLLRIAL
ncbi:tripartite tricarboxylate transporter TctB family protein [Microterricola pindariensis]|uniref:tripartite tricarboxylate transporter TctB family protein n=1 Tax=Microterricola pindariensis TaxID=478010 RepID=UPI000CEBCAB5|nr:tripartite tricarboxylate transporter TctB family protein [Microterricola pindariensis]